MKRTKWILAISVIAIVVLFDNCGVRYQTARSYLQSDSYEDDGYGLYSYILFAKPPDNFSKARYISLIETYLNRINEVEKFQRNIPKDSLNIVYFPVTIELKSSFSNLNNNQQAEWLLENYDYARARFYLNKFEESLMIGPYIVSYSSSLSKTQSVRTGFIVQDFSKVHPKVVPLWVDAFINQSSKAEYWDGEFLNTFTDNLRNTISVAAEALNVVQASLDEWRLWFSKWLVVK